MEHLILSRKFLVFPTSTENESAASIEEFTASLETFWPLDSMCSDYLEDIFKANARLYSLKTKCVDAKSYWSTSYPDPKTDMTNKVGIELDYRIF